jgi:hypothetical protein
MRNKRVAFSVEDAILIKAALVELRKASLLNPIAHPEYALATDQRINQIIDKLPKIPEKNQ